MTLRCLFVDFNSYFASVEQYDEPRLRDRPVGVVPVIAATTCCIAASSDAKKFGVKTGTPVWEALERCPEIKLVEARPARYVEIHHKLMQAIEDCIPHGKAESIDEVPCWLIGRERQRDNAEAIAFNIKRVLYERFGAAIRCSIGIAPNKFLAKTASDMVKPDGLTVIEQQDLPHKLHALELRDLCGIGASMEHRLRCAGIQNVEQLCAAPREYLRAAWGSIEGERYWLKLRGFELPEAATPRHSIGHSHVLGPELRHYDGMRAVLFKLLAKAAMRLRHEHFLAGGLAIRIRFIGLESRFERDLVFAPLDDTPTLLRQLGEQLDALNSDIVQGRWNQKRHPPLSVAVTLVGLESVGSLTEELMEERRQGKRICMVLDRINQRYGNNALYFGAMQHALAHDAAPMRIPFANIPNALLEADAAPPPDSGEELWLQRERQFKVLAEAAHRESQQRQNKKNDADTQKSGAGGWLPSLRKPIALITGENGSLF